jgi:1,4-dihydroxy-6-naphthoate synthase
MRFTYAADGLHLVRDLGEHWETATGYPIPLGAVALAKPITEADPGIENAVEAAIRRSLAWSYAHPEQALALCRLHSQSMADAVLKAHIDLYVNAFSRDIGSEGEAAVGFFFERQRAFRSSVS